MASTDIKNSKQLTDVILDRYAASALQLTQKEIYNSIQESINEYYHEYSPDFYSRKFKFLNSLIKTEIVRLGNNISCEVKIDESYLKYSYPNQMSDDLSATGLDVVKWANRESGYGNHGGTVDAGRSEGFWDIGLRDMGGEIGILTVLKNNLKKRGLNLI